MKPVDVTIAPMPNGSSSSIAGPSLFIAMQSESSSVLPGLEKDQVLRVLDGNTIKLKKNGIVTLAGVRMPTPGSGKFQFPECLSYAPVYKVRQLLPANLNVMVKVGSSTSASKSSQAIVLRSDDYVLVNQELIRSGFGRVQKVVSDDLKEYLDMDKLSRLQDQAKQEGIGIFKRCDVQVNGGNFEAQFEPLELTMETQWGDDGGKTVVRQKDAEPSMPRNPGDVKGTLRNGEELSDKKQWALISSNSCLKNIVWCTQAAPILGPTKMRSGGMRPTSPCMGTWRNWTATVTEFHAQDCHIPR